MLLFNSSHFITMHSLIPVFNNVARGASGRFQFLRHVQIKYFLFRIMCTRCSALYDGCVTNQRAVVFNGQDVEYRNSIREQLLLIPRRHY